MKTNVLFSIILMCFLITDLTAKERWGGGVSLGVHQAQDEMGNTDTADELFFSAINTRSISPKTPNQRLWYELSYRSFTTDAHDAFVGQQTNSLGLDAIYQHSFNVSRFMTPWVGIGGGISFNDFLNRVTVDDSGFAKDRFDDTFSVGYHALVNVGFNLRQFSPGYWAGITYSYQITQSIGVQGHRLNLFLLI